MRNFRNFRPYRLPTILLSAALAACSTQGASTMVPTTASHQGTQDGQSNAGTLDRTIAANLSPSLSAKSRAYMAQIMTQLRPFERKNVIAFDANGHLYANRPSLLAGVRFWRGVPGTVGLVRSDDGKEMRFTEDTVTNGPLQPIANLLPNTCEGTGFCHSRYSDDTGTGFQWEQVAVAFPCNSMSLISGDGGYAYVGSLDSTEADNEPSVDAGLQVIGGVNTVLPSIQGAMFINGPNGKVAVSVPSNHLICTTATETISATLTYHFLNGSSTNSSVVLNVQSSQLQNGAITIVGNGAAKGYVFPGSCACQVKTVTSIATGNLSSRDGSYFGVEGINSNNPTPAVQWFGASKGYWTSGTNFQPDGFLYKFGVSPSQLGSSPIVLCNPQSSTISTEETTGINLDTNTPQKGSTFCPQ